MLHCLHSGSPISMPKKIQMQVVYLEGQENGEVRQEKEGSQ